MIDIRFDNKEFNFKNGLKLITVKKDTELFSIDIGIKIGAYYENDKNRGISHFIEHMLFKGTKKRSNELLNKELEFLGGEYNAYTNYNTTVFNISCLKEECRNAVELLGDMVMNSVFDEEEMKREKGVVISEIRSARDDVAEFSANQAFNYAFEKSPLRYEVAGFEDIVSGFTRDELLEYYKNNYTPDNTVITVVSPFDHKTVYNMISDEFSEWTGTCSIDRSIIREDNKNEEFVSCRKDIEQSTITIIYSFIDLDKEDELALKILNHQLGESANSILFWELREKRGLVYDIYTDLDLCHNAKTLCIYTATHDSKVEEAKDAIFKCIDDVKNEKIIFNERTLELMKKVHKTSVISTFEDGSDLGNYILTQNLEGQNIYEFLEDMNKLEMLDSADIYKVARKILNKPTVYMLRGSDTDE